MLLCLSVALPAEADWLNGWGPKQINGTYQDASQELGPVVARLDDGSNAKCVIVAEAHTLRVYNANGNERFHITFNQNETIRFIPAVGDVVPGNGHDEIVICTHVTGMSGYLKVYAGNSANNQAPLATSVACAEGQPVLADLESTNAGSREDGDMEVIVAPPNGLFVYDYDGNVGLQQVADAGNIPSAAFDGDAPITPAIGDANGDGKKEIVLHYMDAFHWWTYDNQSQNRLTNYRRRDYEYESIDHGLGFGYLTTLADIDNDGKLWALAPYKYHQDDPPGDEPGGRMVVLDLFANPNAQLGSNGAEHSQYDGDPGEVFPSKPQSTPDMVAVGDMADYSNNPIGLNQGGHLVMSARFMPMQLFNHTSFTPGGWPHSVGQVDGTGRMPAIANVGTSDQNPLDYRVIISHEWVEQNQTEYAVAGFRIAGGSHDFGWTLVGNENFCAPAVADLLGDGHLQVISRTLPDGNPGDERIYAMQMWTTYDTHTDNELNHIEWSQLGNGPRHQGLYAQPYSGWLPNGSTIWRDRVVVTNNVHFGHDGNVIPARTAYLRITDNTVVEFNPGAGLSRTEAPVHWDLIIGDNVVFKGNPISMFSLPVVSWHSLRDVHVFDGGFSIGSGDTMTFENCSFVGNSSGSAITVSGSISTNTVINLTHCTFDNYATALDLSYCTGTIDSCTFTNMTGTAILVQNCTSTEGLKIQNSTISGTAAAALYIYNSKPLIKHCDITNNNGGLFYSAIYCYNSSPHLRDNDIHGNTRIGMIASGGGYPALTTYGLSDPHRNRFSQNNTTSHTARADSTWAELVQRSPTYIGVDYGHNDFVNTYGSTGDYLISNQSYYMFYSLYARYNYWNTPGSLGPNDFYPNNSVYYSPADINPNHTSSAEDEEAAFNLFAAASIEADSGQFSQAYQDFRAIVANYPGTSAALGALSRAKDCGRSEGESYGALESYYGGVVQANSGTELGTYADRMNNICLLDEGRYDYAIANCEAALEGQLSHQDSLYYEIDAAHAELARVQAGGGNLDASTGDKKVALETAQKKVFRLIGELNGIHTDQDGAMLPQKHGLLSCYPNPFNSTININFALAEEGKGERQSLRSDRTTGSHVGGREAFGGDSFGGLESRRASDGALSGENGSRGRRCCEEGDAGKVIQT